MVGRDHDRYVEALLASPLGCSFLRDATLSGVPVERIADPRTAFRLAGQAWSAVSPWASQHEAIIADQLRDAGRWATLASAIVSDPRNAWWFADLLRSDQLRYTEGWTPEWWDAAQRQGVEQRRAHERYTQRPFLAPTTSTAFNGLSSFLVAESDVV